MGEYVLADLRNEPLAVREWVGSHRLEVVKGYPHDLFCDFSTGKEADRRALKVATTDRERDQIKRRIQKLSSVRNTLADWRGEANPLDFSIRRDGKLFGSWQIFGIKILAENERRIRIGNCGWFPAFPLQASPRQVVRLAMDLKLGFLDARIPLESGRVLDLRSWEVPVLTDESRGSELDLITETFKELSERAEFDVTRTPIDGQAGRERILLMRSLAPRVPRDDPFELAVD